MGVAERRLPRMSGFACRLGCGRGGASSQCSGCGVGAGMVSSSFVRSLSAGAGLGRRYAAADAKGSRAGRRRVGLA